MTTRTHDSAFLDGRRTGPVRGFLRRVVAGGAIAGALAALAACGGFQPSPTSLDITITANETLNPNSENQSSPVIVRVYELKSLSAFNQATMFDLIDNDTKVLGADLIGREDMEIKPGETKTIKKDTAPETRFIGVMAGFRDLDSAVWRAQTNVVKEKTNVITVTLTALAVTVSSKAHGRLF